MALLQVVCTVPAAYATMDRQIDWATAAKCLPLAIVHTLNMTAALAGMGPWYDRQTRWKMGRGGRRRVRAEGVCFLRRFTTASHTGVMTAPHPPHLLPPLLPFFMHTHAQARAA